MEIAVYKSLLEIQNVSGIPQPIFIGLVAFGIILAIFIKLWAIFPFMIIFMLLKTVSKDDPLFLIIFFTSFKNKNYYNP